MSILCERFVNPPEGSHEWKALVKAVEEQPQVVLIGRVGGVDYYQVSSTRELDVSYPVRVWQDKDRDYIQNHEVEVRDEGLFLRPTEVLATEGQYWIECFCPGASPPFDPSLRNLICWLPKVCYHAAAVIIHVSQEYG